MFCNMASGSSVSHQNYLRPLSKSGSGYLYFWKTGGKFPSQMFQTIGLLLNALYLEERPHIQPWRCLLPFSLNQTHREILKSWLFVHLRKKKKKPTNFQELHSEGPVVVEHAVPFHSPYMNCSASSTAANNLHVIQLSYIGQTLANHLVCNGIAFFAYCLAGQKRTSHGVKLKKRSKLDEEGVHRFRH